MTVTKYHLRNDQGTLIIIVSDIPTQNFGNSFEGGGEIPNPQIIQSTSETIKS